MRQDNNKRKEKRLEKEERKKEILKQEQEELKHLKSLVRQEIVDKIKKIEETSGAELKGKGKDFYMQSRLIELVQNKLNVIMEKDFDPNDYDKIMNEQFGDDYYGDEDMNEEELQGKIKVMGFFVFILIEYIKQQEEEYDKIPETNDDEETKVEQNGKKENKKAKQDEKDTLLQSKTAIPIYNRVGIKET